MEFDMKKDSRRILVIVLASALMAFNIKSFVRTGGLYICSEWKARRLRHIT